MPKSVNSAALIPYCSGRKVGNGQLHRADGVELAAERVALAEADVARADAGDLEAAEGVAALEEAVVDPDVVAAPAVDVAGRAVER